MHEWVSEGAPVMIVTGSGSTEWLVRSVVERVTKTQVIVAEVSGRPTRFRLSDLSEVGRHDPWARSAQLLDPADSQVQARYAACRERARRATVSGKVEKLMARWRKDQDDAAAREALQLLTEALDRPF